MTFDTHSTIQANSSPAIFHQTELEDDKIDKRYFYCTSNTNIVVEASSNNTNIRLVASKNKPEPLKLSSTNLKFEGFLNNMDIDYDDEDTSTPKILTSTTSSRRNSKEAGSDRPMFFMSEVRDTQPHVQEIKAKIDKAITSGSAYLQIPTATGRRRHSWMNR